LAEQNIKRAHLHLKPPYIRGEIVVFTRLCGAILAPRHTNHVIQSTQKSHWGAFETKRRLQHLAAQESPLRGFRPFKNWAT